MSLNAVEKKQTAFELKKNYEISELTPNDIKDALGFNISKKKSKSKTKNLIRTRF